MSRLPPDGDLAGAAPFGARVVHRLAMHVPSDTMRLRLDAPLVSITFDDAPDSACMQGARLLDDHGARGTFYIAGSLIGTWMPHWRVAEEEQIAALHEAGHEIGCHTFTHAFLPDLDRSAIDDEFRRNRSRLGSFLPGLDISSFAYPYGYSSLTAKRALSHTVRTSRGIAPGVNKGRVDRQMLRANPMIEGRIDADTIARLMDRAVAERGWLIFYGHDVTARPSPYGCTPKLLETILSAAKARDIPCVTMDEGMRRASSGPARAPSTLS